MVHFLTLEDIRDICYEYAKAHLTQDEPIPSFETRYPGTLEAVLACPQIIIASQLAYPTLHQQASVLFYELIKQHPFVNGNKRIACVALMAFLTLHDTWLEMSWRQLYDIAVTVASSRSDNREGMLKLLADFIQTNATNRV